MDLCYSYHETSGYGAPPSLPQAREMTKHEIVKLLVKQIAGMGLMVMLVTLDAGF